MYMISSGRALWHGAFLPLTFPDGRNHGGKEVAYD